MSAVSADRILELTKNEKLSLYSKSVTFCHRLKSRKMTDSVFEFWSMKIEVACQFLQATHSGISCIWQQHVFKPLIIYVNLIDQ